MLTDAMISADRHLKFIQDITQPAKYVYLTDDIWPRIERSTEPVGVIVVNAERLCTGIDPCMGMGSCTGLSAGDGTGKSNKKTETRRMKQRDKPGCVDGTAGARERGSSTSSTGSG
jgi:hypothetical protein